MKLRIGQIVPYPPAPDGWAQIDELLRCNVVLLYVRERHICRARVKGELLGIMAREPLLFQDDENRLGRGVGRGPREKEYA